MVVGGLDNMGHHEFLQDDQLGAIMKNKLASTELEVLQIFQDL